MVMTNMTVGRISLEICRDLERLGRPILFRSMCSILTRESSGSISLNIWYTVATVVAGIPHTAHLADCRDPLGGSAIRPEVPCGRLCSAMCN